jgi:ATP-dependent helicase/nuclease subunit B
MELLQVAAGRAFTCAMRDTVHQLKAGDPLQPVRVIVPSNLAGLSIRRMLGSRLLDDEPSDTPLASGIANVSFSTPFQHASLLASPALAARGVRPLTTAVLAAAVRHVLATSPGRFGAVAEHVATETALIRAYAEITEMPPARRRALASSSSRRTTDLIRFVEAVAEHLATGTSTSYHDEYTVLTTAAAQLDRPLDEAIVLAGPFSQGLATIEFLRSLVLGTHGQIVFAVTGDHDVDAGVRQQAELLLGRSVEPVSAAVPQPSALVSTADSDEEVRSVTRQVLEAAERGVRFDRMAVFVPVLDPYLRSIREHFDAAGIPSAGPDHRTLADSMAGRLLNRLIQLADTTSSTSSHARFEREAVLALVEAAPLHGPDGRRIRAEQWENISRSAGVVAGLDEWSSRLEAHEESLERRIEERRAEASSGALDQLARDRAATDALRAFVVWLAGLIDPRVVGATWIERSEWARTVLARLLPPENKRHGWPESEIAAAERVDRILARVGVLDDIEPTLTASAFRRAIQLELEVPAGRRGRFGTGVLVAPLASAFGLDLDEVFVLGLAEGLCPRPIREDTLLPDAERALTAGALSTRADRNREDRQCFLHAMASGSGATTLVTPLGDHRSGRTRTVSRWWVEAVRSLADDDTVTSQNWSDTDLPIARGFGSYDEALTSAVVDGMVTSDADLQLQYIHADARFGVHPDDSMIAGALRRGLEQTEQRLLGFTRFTGDLTSIEVPAVVNDDSAISSSRLESWASCPRRYYFEQLLRLGEIERPEEISEISALDKGNLWHQILEDFIRESLPDGPHHLADPDQRWSTADRERLGAIAQRWYTKYEELGRTGRAILWAIKVEETNADLDAFLRSDEEHRTDLRSVPVDVELPFGLSRRGASTAEPAAVVALGDGRTIRLRGLIDRVDLRADGVPVVLDYKTGKPYPQTSFEVDPVLGGTKLQLGVYAEAARQRYDTDEAYAYYWFTSSKGEFKRVGYPWTNERRDRFTDVVDTIVDGIERGSFPPNPGDYNSFWGSFTNCGFCPFTRICPVDRDEELEQAIQSGRLVDYVQMQEPPPEEPRPDEIAEGAPL